MFRVGIVAAFLTWTGTTVLADTVGRPDPAHPSFPQNSPADAPAASPGESDSTSRGFTQLKTPVRIGVWGHYPPYVHMDGNTFSGIEVDVIREAFQQLGLSVEINTAPGVRLQRMMELGRLDARVAHDTSASDCFSTTPFVMWEDVLLIRREIDLNSARTPGDLKGLRIAIYPQGRKEFESLMASYGFAYDTVIEIPNTALALNLMREKHVDLLFGERRLLLQEATDGGVTLADNFDVLVTREDPHHLCLSSRKLRDQLNPVLENMQQNGMLALIMNKYQPAAAMVRR